MDSLPDKSQIYGNSLSDARVQSLELESASADQAVNIQENHAIISYKLRFTAKEGGITAVKNKTLILNDQGRVVGELPENSRGCDMPVVTDDGRYLACFYGGINAEGSISSAEPLGILIYDLNNNSTIVDLSSSSGYDLYRPIAYGSVIVVEVRNPGGSHTFHAYLPKERKLFKKTYTKQEIERLAEINKQGVVFTNPDDSRSTSLFTRDFSSESF